MFQRIFSIIQLLLLLVVQVSCRNTAATEEESVKPVTPVTVTSVSVITMKSTSDLPAVSSFLKKSTVRATAAGYLQKVDVTQGDNVSANQLLFALRTRESMALENMKSTDSTLNFTGLINIKSPGAGIVTLVKYQAGDFVQEGDELANIADRGSLVFILEVPVEMDKFIPSNRNCTVVLPDSENLKGTITGKLPEMALETQTVRYMIKVSSAANIPENLIANVPIIKSTHENSTVLPRKAVLSNETQTEFWVMKLISDSIAVKTPVQPGIENDTKIEITDPKFLPADRIILTGNYGLPDTAYVTVSKE